jgi:hypothetical protein
MEDDNRQKYGDANLCLCACIWYCNMIWCTIHIDHHPTMTMHGGHSRAGMAWHSDERKKQTLISSYIHNISQCPNFDLCVYLVCYLLARSPISIKNGQNFVLCVFWGLLFWNGIWWEAFSVTKYLTSICQSTFRSLRKSLRFCSVLSHLREAFLIVSTHRSQCTFTVHLHPTSQFLAEDCCPWEAFLIVFTHRSQCTFPASQFVLISQPMHLHC